MTDYTKLVEALRYCGNFTEREGCDESCEYFNDMDCPNRIMSDAAAAIEALEARLGEAENSVERWKDMYLTKHEPKRGEWIEHGEPPMLVVECSVCGQNYFNHVMQEKAKYCSMCGAKMEVQDG